MVLMGAKGSPVIYIFLNKMGFSNQSIYDCLQIKT